MSSDTKSEPWLDSMATDPSRLKREAVIRKKSYQVESLPNALADDYINNKGWELDKKLKIKTRVKKPWPHDLRLENRAWMLAYLLGYPEISAGRNFKVKIQRKGANPLYKQIDLLAKDDETVLVTECKSSERVTKNRSLQKDIEEFSNLQKPIADAIRKHYGAGFKPKIIWLFITNKIAWSKNDSERAKGAGINVITDKELRYYLQIADHLRSAARFQFLAEFLQNQKIPELNGVKVPAVKGKLGGKTIYSFVSTPRQMLKIAFVNHRSLNDPAGAPSYQRLVTRTRLNQIKKFISNGGFFPTNILVNFTSQCKFEQIAKDGDTNVAFGNLCLPNKYRSAWIIDGQHRLYGYAPLTDKFLDQHIMVVGFEGLKKEEEANLFVTINHEQKSVPKTLLDDLEGELKWGSDKPTERIGAISARLIGRLNSDVGEALYGRVTQQGIKATEKTCLTVPAIKDGIRRSGLVGRAILNKKEYQPGALSDVDDSKTLERSRETLNLYFQAICDANTSQWEAGRQGQICTNVSLQAYLQLLASMIEYMESNKGLEARELNPEELIAELEEYLDPILVYLSSAKPQDIEARFKVPFGSGGPREYYFRLCTIIREKFSDFAPEGMDEWLEERSEDKINEAEHKLKEINIYVQKTIFNILKREYGTEKDAYWNKGVTDKSIKQKAYGKALEDNEENPMPLENYLDFIEYKKIVENKQHWPLFKPFFDIPEPGEKGKAKNLSWMFRINELRRIPAHPTESRHFKTADFEYIDFAHAEFMERLNAHSMEGEIEHED